MTTAMTDLHARFVSAARAVGATSHEDAVFAVLEAAYREPHRAYHATSHVEHALAVLDSVAHELRAPAEVELAIWFHDAIYESHPLASNEERSAALAKDALCRMGATAAAAERIAAMVLATKRHVLPAGLEHDADAQAFLDIDLAILGEDALAYATFEQGVRHEYGWVLESMYREKRAAILEGFLARPRLFHHPALAARFEERARVNLAGALQALRAPDTDTRHLHATDEVVVPVVPRSGAPYRR